MITKQMVDDGRELTVADLKNLRLNLERGGFTDPNRRTIALYLGDEKLTEVSFDVTQTREYEG